MPLFSNQKYYPTVNDISSAIDEFIEYISELKNVTAVQMLREKLTALKTIVTTKSFNQKVRQITLECIKTERQRLEQQQELLAVKTQESLQALTENDNAYCNQPYHIEICNPSQTLDIAGMQSKLFLLTLTIGVLIASLILFTAFMMPLAFVIHLSLTLFAAIYIPIAVLSLFVIFACICYKSSSDIASYQELDTALHQLQQNNLIKM